MKRLRHTWVIAVLACASNAFAIKPTWAKKAVVFPEECRDERFAECKNLSIKSPDGKSVVEVSYTKQELDSGDGVLEASLRVTTPGRGTRDADLPYGFQNVDLQWAPDSRAFFLNGGNGGAYWGFWVYIVRVDVSSASLEALDVTKQAQIDMVRQFPPCKAKGHPPNCEKIGSNPEDLDYNMSGIDWVGDSSTIVVVAEVPCSSSQGGVMCQVMGYQLGVPSGKILKRINAKQLKREWQKTMAWKFYVPDPPEYE